jgi:hypothetical protein
MRQRLIPVCLLAALMSCGKPTLPPPADPTPDPWSAASEAAAPAEVSSVAPAGDELAADETELNALLGELTQLVRRYGLEQRRAPKSLDDLVTAGYLTQVPPPPAGKRYAINRNLQVYVADR